MNIYEYILMALAALNLIAIIIGFYKQFREPDEKADKKLSVMDSNCELKHKRIDEIISEIKTAISGINYTFQHFKENEFNHIEAEMRRMSDIQTEIKTILNERFTKKL